LQQFQDTVSPHHKSKRTTGTTATAAADYGVSSSGSIPLNVRWLRNDEPYRIWKEVIAAYFAVPFQDIMGQVAQSV
jgi:hypothetical protein